MSKKSKKGTLRKLERKDRKILRKILGLVKENGSYRRKQNNELFEHREDIVTAIRERRMMFYGHLERMN